MLQNNSVNFQPSQSLHAIRDKYPLTTGAILILATIVGLPYALSRFMMGSLALGMIAYNGAVQTFAVEFLQITLSVVLVWGGFVSVLLWVWYHDFQNFFYN